MINLVTFETIDALIDQTEKLLRTTLQSEGHLMLSGGSTPYVIYNRLAKDPGPVHPARKLFLSDERMVPLNSPSNNAHNLIPMLQALKCEDRFIRVNPLLPIEQAAAHFALELDALNPIDLGFLGMGDDGHTAGFFTIQQARQKIGALTLFTERPDGMQGVSVTPTLLQRVHRIILLVTGESKKEILHTLLHHPQTIPAGIALSDHPDVEVWTDLSLT